LKCFDEIYVFISKHMCVLHVPGYGYVNSILWKVSLQLYVRHTQSSAGLVLTNPSSKLMP